jgi:uncharacterized integral membrane protein
MAQRLPDLMCGQSHCSNDLNNERKVKYMLSIFLSMIFGLAIGYFATQNTSPVTIQFGELVLESVPLYMIAVGSLILGLLIGLIFYLARSVSTLRFVGKDHETERARRTVIELEHKVHALEAENARLRNEIPDAPKFPVAAGGLRR